MQLDDSKKRGLGRGLDALIPLEDQFSSAMNEQVAEVAIHEIKPNPLQPRKTFDENSLAELAESIKEYGIIQPLIVTKEGNAYQLIAGERRWRAAQKVGLEKVPVVIRDAEELKKLEIAIVENVQRDNLNSIEEAAGYRQLMENFSLSQEDVAKKVGKSRSGIANKLRLLSLPIEVQKAIRNGEITEGHGRALLALDNPEKILALFNLVVRDGLSVRQTESMSATDIKGSNDHPSFASIERDPNIKKLEDELREVIGCRVLVKTKKSGGSLTISYGSNDELEKIISFFVKKNT